MPSYEYRVVPFIGNISSAQFSRQNAQAIAEQLQSVIAENASGGWEYYRIDQVQVPVAPGCLGGLMGRKQGIVLFDQVVFRREA